MAAEPIELTTKPQALGGAAHSGGCACGHADEGEIVLDTRTIPHAIRHATIFGALGAIAPGFSLDLVANHNPLPLLNQLEKRTPGMFDVAYIDDGPDVWRLRFTREQSPAPAPPTVSRRAARCAPQHCRRRLCRASCAAPGSPR